MGSEGAHRCRAWAHGGTAVQRLSHAPDLEQIIRDRRSALQSAEAIGDLARCSNQEEEGTDMVNGDEISLSGSLSETGTVTAGDTTDGR
ncbi:hypothetical protein NDU88_003171 [Pleurodeles waltl]|uniref:Uncharacterized protein n=1 Tax=Pleurodeles waltl TaxID=8319 RepID=A0AAV7W5A6_PLEWA|nr:hypothetical protein NDU88_003171 [Pleurodeles waltl]